MKTERPIVFIDFDKTICFDKYWRSLSPEDFQVVQEFIFGQDRTLVNEWMVGKQNAEEINRLLAEKIGMPFEDLWNLFVKDCSSMQIAPEVLEKILSLREKYAVILVTANMDSFTRFTVPALRLDQYFDHINNSFFEGRFKTDDKGALFLEYARTYKVPISDCHLIDDSEKACETFVALGGTAHQITPQANVSHYIDMLLV